MTRKDQIDVVAHVAGITPAQARMAVDAVGGLVKAGLLEEQKVSLAGIGTFTVQRRSAKTIRHPKTGLVMELPPTAGVKFRPTPDLRKSVEERHG